MKRKVQVVLKANRAEGWKRETAFLLFVEPNGTVGVQVLEREPGDDGLREVTPDQIEPVPCEVCGRKRVPVMVSEERLRLQPHRHIGAAEWCIGGSGQEVGK